MATEGRQILNPPNHPPFSPTYSHICSVPISNSSRLVSFAGQVGHDPKTGKTPETLAGQIEVALDNVDRCLAAAGAKKEDIISVRHFVVNLQPIDPAIAQLLSTWIGEHKPPSTLLGVQCLATPELLYEIEVMAVVTKPS
jgi:enamine deaminase RidA (YjgF/YER057c/UK114 family)